MKEAYDLTSAHAKKSAETGKRQYNKRLRHTALYEGDRVCVRHMNERGGPGKLRPCWEQQIYVVTRKMKDMLVYEVKPENGDGRSRVLHHNLLMPCPYLPVESETKRLKSSQRASRSTSKQVIPQEEFSGATDEEVTSLTPNHLQEFYGSTYYHKEDNAGFAAGLTEQDVDRHQADDLESEHDMEGPAQPEAMLDNAVDGAPPRRSQQRSTLSVRITYDTLGQPSLNLAAQLEGKVLQHHNHNSLYGDRLQCHIQYHGCYNLSCSLTVALQSLPCMLWCY